MVDRIADAVSEMLSSEGRESGDIKAVGVGSPGVMDIEAGVVVTANNLKFDNVPLRQMFRDRFDRPAVLENDANVTAWGEHVAGAGRGANEMILITLGTGVGGGIISNGELVHGFSNNAGELGHVIMHPNGRLCNCGQKGCVEAYGSASSTAARATEAIQDGAESSLKKLLEENGEITGEDVYEHCAKGDELAKKITDGTAQALAILCICLLHTTGPRRIVFYGGMIGAGNLLLDPIKSYFKKHIWHLKEEPLELCFAALGKDAGIIGTAALAMHYLEQGKLS
jgi:glucokinase